LSTRGRSRTGTGRMERTRKGRRAASGWSWELVLEWSLNYPIGVAERVSSSGAVRGRAGGESQGDEKGGAG